MTIKGIVVYFPPYGPWHVHPNTHKVSVSNVVLGHYIRNNNRAETFILLPPRVLFPVLDKVEGVGQLPINF